MNSSPDMIRSFAERTRAPVALFDRPWNPHVGEGAMRDDVVRCRHWDQLIARFPRPGREQGR